MEIKDQDISEAHKELAHAQQTAAGVRRSPSEQGDTVTPSETKYKTTDTSQGYRGIPSGCLTLHRHILELPTHLSRSRVHPLRSFENDHVHDAPGVMRIPTPKRVLSRQARRNAAAGRARRNAELQQLWELLATDEHTALTSILSSQKKDLDEAEWELQQALEEVPALCTQCSQ